MTNHAQRSFTLLEVMIAMVVLVVAIFGTVASMGVSMQLRQTSDETERASQARDR